MARPDPVPEFQPTARRRPPHWRWARAKAIVGQRRHFSRLRDGPATGIAVGYLRERAQCQSPCRRRNFRKRWSHVDDARLIWEARDDRRLELEARILARQNDSEIALAQGLSPSTVQAFCDLFFDVRDRLNASSYILFKVAGLPRCGPAPLPALLKASAYAHGPHVIEPWMRFLRRKEAERDLSTAEGRLMARIALYVRTVNLPENEETGRTWARITPTILSKRRRSPTSVPVAGAFAALTTSFVAGLDLPSRELPPLSYAPGELQRWRKARTLAPGEAA